MAKIRSELLKRSFTSTPIAISEDILSFCAAINEKAVPSYVEYREYDNCTPSECFNNVSMVVEKHGGRIIYGWAIWEWPRVFLEAEHHAVWSRDGKIIDVTPKVHGEKTILFLPQEEISYDYINKTRIINKKRALWDLPQVHRWIAATDEFHKFIESHSIGHLVQFQQFEVEPLVAEIQRSLEQIILELDRITAVNDACICGSGIKYKKCCKRYIEK